MTEEELKKKCTERAKIFQQVMESCHSSSPMDCIEWFADRIAELEKKLTEKVTLESLDVVFAKINGLENNLTKAKEIMQQLITNAPNTYSGTDIELQQKKMFSFQDAINKAEQFLKE